jgi:PAS domain S-box-containing protein
MLNLLTDQPISLDQAIAREPLLVVSPDASLPEVIELFHGARGTTCDLVSTPIALQIIPTCVFVVNQEKLVGIVTERDLVKLVAKGAAIMDSSKVTEIMSHPVIALPQKELKDIFEVLSLFRINKIRHLPILNEQGSPLGCITHGTLRQVLRSVDLLRLRAVKEVMHPNVIHAPPTTSILAIAQLMAHHRVSCIVIVESFNPHSPSAAVHYKPLGIITERDIIQFQALGLDVRQITAETVMSCPLTLVSSNEALDHAYGIMKQKRIQRLVVSGTQGELAGIITQSSVLQILNPSDMYGLINVLQEKVSQLETEKINLLENRNDELEKLVAERTIKLKNQAQIEKLKSELNLKIRDSHQLSTILETIVAEIRDFMSVDRVMVYGFHDDLSGTVVAESVGERWTTSIDQNIKDTCLQGGLNVRYRRGWYWKMEDIEQARLTDCHRDLLRQFEVKAGLVIPIVVADIESVSSLLVTDDPMLSNLSSRQGHVWGLLILHQCDHSREWPTETIALLETLVDQVAIAIRQSVALEMANQEIANRQLIDKKLQEVNSKWTSFVENSPNTVYTLTPEGIVLSVNHFRQGETPESIIGSSFYDLTPSYLREKRKEQIENVLQMGMVITDDGERPNLDGSLNYYQVQIIPVWQFRKITKILVVLIDISDRRKVEVQLHQLNEELEDRVEQRTIEVIERETR